MKDKKHNFIKKYIFLFLVAVLTCTGILWHNSEKTYAGCSSHMVETKCNTCAGRGYYTPIIKGAVYVKGCEDCGGRGRYLYTTQDNLYPMDHAAYLKSQGGKVGTGKQMVEGNHDKTFIDNIKIMCYTLLS